MIVCVTVLMGMLTLSVMREEKEVIANRNKSIQRINVNEEEGKDDVFTDNDLNRELDGSNPSESDNENNESDIKDSRVQQDSSNRNNRPHTLRREESFQLERTKMLFRQASFYVLTFYITWAPSTIGALLAFFSYQARGYPPFAILVLICTFEPMQGFWNSLGKLFMQIPCEIAFFCELI